MQKDLPPPSAFITSGLKSPSFYSAHKKAPPKFMTTADFTANSLDSKVHYCEQQSHKDTHNKSVSKESNSSKLSASKNENLNPLKSCHVLENKNEELKTENTLTSFLKPSMLKLHEQSNEGELELGSKDSSETLKCESKTDILMKIRENELIQQLNVTIKDLQSEITKLLSENANVQTSNEKLCAENTKLLLKNEILTNDFLAITKEKDKAENDFRQSEMQQREEIEKLYEKYKSHQQQLNSEKELVLKRLNNSEEAGLQKDKQISELSLELNKLKAVLLQSEDKSNVYLNKITSYEDSIRYLKSENEALRNELVITEKEKENLEEQVNKTTKQLSSFENIIKENDKNIKGLTHKVLLYEKEKNEQENGIKKLEIKLIEFDENAKKVALKHENIHEQAVRRNEILNERISSLTTENKNLELNIHEKEEQLVNRESEIDELKVKIEELKTRMASRSLRLEKLDDLEVSMPQLTQKILHLQSVCETLQSSNEMLNVQLHSLQEMLTMQERTVAASVVGNHKQLLTLWRNKVYALLVQLKSQEIS